MKIKDLDELSHILDWQQRGATARVLGLPRSANPLLSKEPAKDCPTRPSWEVLANAWMFGWMVESCFRDDVGNIAA
jgi:hypothetical protein